MEDPSPSEVCQAYDDVLREAHHRLWLAVPWVYSHGHDPWLTAFVDGIAALARRGSDVRAYLRPSQNNAGTVATWRAAGVRIVQGTPAVRYLHAKLVLADELALLTSANLIDADLHRNVNQFSIERRPEELARWAAFIESLEAPPEPAPEPATSTWEPAKRLLPPELLRYINVDQLNPMQSMAVPRVLHSSRNLVVAAPTGSGKTLVAEAALLDAAVHQHRTGVYLVPMRALASEKRQDWRRFEATGLRIYKTSGEDDAFDPAQAQRADIIVATPEKWDAVSRRRLPESLVSRIGTIVADEIHLVDEPGRGAALEALLSRIRLAFPAARLVAMSGTLPNGDAIARWLDAELIASAWRPVRLDNIVVPYPEAPRRAEDEALRNGLVASIAQEALVNEHGTVLVFCGSRAGVENCAALLAESLDLEPNLRTLPSHKGLRDAMGRGVAWHHAGLSKDDRALVERSFRDGVIRVLVATTTVAVGLNLPASDVIVRDLTLGMTDLSSASLLQMAGRAGRPGLQPDGRCYVLAPEQELARVQEMLLGGVLHSRLADDVATHVNTEIALGIVTSRQQLGDWYARTLHRQLAAEPVDPAAALEWLLANNFVDEVDGVLKATALGIATSHLMLQVTSAAGLEQFLAERMRRTEDPDRLEDEILLAVCGRPAEFEALVTRKGDEDDLRRIVNRDKHISEWTLGRVRYLVGAVAVLTGIDAGLVGLDDAASLMVAVQRDVPRFLRFLARRADERAPGSPDIVVAATDLAAALEAGIAERGCGRLLEAIKFGYPADENRRRKTVAEYGRLRASGITTLVDAASEINERARQVVQTLPVVELALSVRHGQIVGSLGHSRRPVRAHVCIASVRQERVTRLDSADPREIDLGEAGDLARSGKLDVSVEVVFTGSGQQAWVYGSGNLSAEVATNQVNSDARVEAMLAKAADQTSYVTAKRKGIFARAIAHFSGSRDLDVLQEQVENPPEAVRRAAALLCGRQDRERERVAATERLVGRRRICVATSTPRTLGAVAAAREITRAEGALLAAALLRATGTDARLVWATIDDEASALCVWRQGTGPWHPMPIWAARHVRVHGERVVELGDDGAEVPPLVGWRVIEAYQQVTPRTLPGLRGIISLETRADEADVERLTCPACQSEMRVRSGPTGSFWGCSRYPTCRQTLPMGGAPDRSPSLSRTSTPLTRTATVRPAQRINGVEPQQPKEVDLPF